MVVFEERFDNPVSKSREKGMMTYDTTALLQGTIRMENYNKTT